MSNFRITFLGCRVLNQTWDHALQVDGKGDEIYFNVELRIVDSAGGVTFSHW